MKKLLALVLITFLFTPISQAANDIKLRYSTQNQPTRFTVNQSMVVGEKGESEVPQGMVIVAQTTQFELSTGE